MTKTRLLLAFLAAAVPLSGQPGPLDAYVALGLKNNLGLRQKEFSYARSVAALREARGMFLPSVGIEARYSRAGGGRIIDLPIGDLMNPVYGTLNTLLEAFGQTAPFPENLPNQRIPFLREKEQETKVRVVQPVFQPALVHLYRIRGAARDIESLSRDAYARQLVADIQAAYFNFLKAGEVESLLERARPLVLEHVRVAERLFANGKATQADVFRGRAEVSALEQQRIEASKNRLLAASYFNFLLNRPPGSEIEKPPSPSPLPALSWSAAEAESLALGRREETAQLDLAIGLAGSKAGLARSALWPGVSAVFDYGSWDETYRFGPDNDFWMASVVASWNLFNGFQDKYRTDQALLEKKERQAEAEALRGRIRMQARDAWESVRAALQAFAAAGDRLSAERKSFELVDRMYREGLSPQIEYLAARNALTRAEVNAAVCEADCQVRFAEFECAAALRPVRPWAGAGPGSAAGPP